MQNDSRNIQIVFITIIICAVLLIPLGIFIGVRINSSAVNNQSSNLQNSTNTVKEYQSVENLTLANDILKELGISKILGFIFDKESTVFGQNVFEVKANTVLLTELNIKEEYIKSTTYEDIQSAEYVNYEIFADTYKKLFNKQYSYIKNEKIGNGGFGFNDDEGHDIICQSRNDEPCYFEWNGTWSFTPYKYEIIPTSIENHVIKGKIVPQSILGDVFVADEDNIVGTIEFKYGEIDKDSHYVERLLLFKNN